jgi:hypothetical protein
MSEKETHLFFALTNVLDDEQEEFNRWYNEEHVPDVLKVPGFVAARRYRRNTAQRTAGPMWEEQQAPPFEYMCVYEIEGDVAEIHERVAATMPERTRTYALAPDHQAWVYTPVGPRITAETAAAASDVPA